MGQEPQKENTHPTHLVFAPYSLSAPRIKKLLGQRKGLRLLSRADPSQGHPPLWGPSPHIPEGSPHVGGRQASSDAFSWSEDPLSWLTPRCPPASHSPRGNPSQLHTKDLLVLCTPTSPFLGHEYRGLSSGRFLGRAGPESQLSLSGL